MARGQQGRKRPFPSQPLPNAAADDVSYSVQFALNRFSGATLVVGDTVFLSDEGIQVLASTSGSYDALNAYTFIDSGGDDIGGLYGRDDPNQNIITLKVTDDAENGQDMVINLLAEADDGAAYVNIEAGRDGQAADTGIAVARTETESRVDIQARGTDGRVRLSPALNLFGADNSSATLYIKGSKLILLYSDGGTPRYKYLDLSGTGASWAYSATEP
jgi:hypothetical protein